MTFRRGKALPTVMISGGEGIASRHMELAPDLEQRFPYLPGGYSARPNPVICG